MAERLTDAELAAWQAFLHAHAAVTNRLDAELVAAQELPLTWYDVLVSLQRADGGRLRMQELARAVMFSRSGVTRLVDRMVASGYVRREPCEDDRRGTYAVLTSDGRRVLRRAAGVHLRGVREHFARHLDPQETKVVARALGRVATAADSARETAQGTMR